ncbi:helix-turn-helix domain-containing protein [Sphingomonas sp.]|uniref:helix-turn-helix domain-containing protein n=1 Tax=Sphingomonas sp. TaxID=28214 RepID=UPI002DBC5D24|nr:helix-turn-helix domain-containing protein [Sphingomonas sp.]HEU4967767.1 helix-turn-helix domain-containing protein [Sphingomonas sp.]
MTTESEPTDGATAGTQLREAREAAGMSLADVAAKTRIPQRHLEAIEHDDFDALPSMTYAVGFARAYARSVGGDEVAVAAMVRSQLEQGGRARMEYQAFEPADPARVPPRTLAWTAAIIALLIIGGYVLWRGVLRDGSSVSPVASASPSPAAVRRAAAPVPVQTPGNGPVVLTATDTVWIRISDATGKRLFEKQMAIGESYTVPPDANGPTILTGRPNALRVTIGGIEVPPLGEPEKTIKDVGVSAEALRARAPSPAPTPSPSVSPGSAPPR